MFKKILGILSIIFIIISCGSQKIVIKKSGVSYKTKEEFVITYKDIRNWYDKKEFEKIFDNLKNMEENNDNFLDYLLIESAYNLDKINEIEPIFIKNNKTTFFKGIISFLNREYDKTIIYLKNNAKKDPVIAYFVGNAYFYLKDYPLAIGYLMLAREWDMPWVYFTLANLYIAKNENKKAYDYIKEAEKACYDFEENMLFDIKVKTIEILLIEEKYNDALTFALNLYKRNPEKTIIYADPGQIYLLQNNQEKALEFWKDAINNNEIREGLKNLLREKISLIEK